MSDTLDYFEISWYNLKKKKEENYAVVNCMLFEQMTVPQAIDIAYVIKLT